jgi:hypothetical protein
LVRGLVFLAEWKFYSGTTKPKFFVVMHVDDQKDVILAFVTTSQLQFFKDNPKLESEIVRIEPGRFAAFTRETAIDCREVHEMRIDGLEGLQKDGKLSFKGQVPASIMQKVLDTVRSSRLLSRKLKRLLGS